jgi:hypothetical protein
VRDSARSARQRRRQTNQLTCGIRGAARLSATAGYPDESLRLWAGAEHIEAATGMRYMPLMERLDRPLRQQCADGFGPVATGLLVEGASRSVAEVTQAAEESLLRLSADNNWRETREMHVAPPGRSEHPWTRRHLGRLE